MSVAASELARNVTYSKPAHANGIGILDALNLRAISIGEVEGLVQRDSSTAIRLMVSFVLVARRGIAGDAREE